MIRRVPLSNHIRGVCVVYACDMGNFHALDLLLSDSVLSRVHLGKALMHSAQHGNCQVMEILASRHEILTEYLYSAFLEAVGNNHLKCVQRLFALYTERLRPYLVESLQLSEEQGLREMEQYLTLLIP